MEKIPIISVLIGYLMLSIALSIFHILTEPLRGARLKFNIKKLIKYQAIYFWGIVILVFIVRWNYNDAQIYDPLFDLIQKLQDDLVCCFDSILVLILQAFALLISF